MKVHERVSVLGVPVDNLDVDELVPLIIEKATMRTFFQISTVNLDFLVHGHDDPEVRSIFAQNGLNIADGAPVAWAGRALGATGLRRVAGLDLVPALAAVASEKGLRLFLLGGQNGAADEAARRLRLRNPGLEVFVHEPPVQSLDEMNNLDIILRIEEAQPHILLVAFGHPKQEKWIYRHRRRLPMVAMGVGCSLDLIAGRRGRAPGWMQASGLEWTYRVAHEPRRLAGRYTRDGLWSISVLLPEVIFQRVSRGQPSPHREPASDSTDVLVPNG
jgi:N-acetylglucosaminyldiphosphoundecaprenol N-acetyl-beta-D-mannosaminyltransferase